MPFRRHIKITSAVEPELKISGSGSGSSSNISTFLAPAVALQRKKQTSVSSPVISPDKRFEHQSVYEARHSTALWSVLISGALDHNLFTCA